MNNNKKALLYAEKYGIIDYEIIDGIMVYKETFSIEGTYLCEVDLNTMKETRKLIKQLF